MTALHAVVDTAAPAGPDPLGVASQRRRAFVWTTGLALVLLVTLVVGVGAGPVAVSPADSARILLHHLTGLPAEVTWERRHDAIIWEIRAPRVLLGAAVGAGLAMAGVVLQAMVRNILADPYVLGINSGASCGAAGAILFGLGAGFGEYALQGSAFVGALLASLLVFLVARSSGRITSVRLLMAGVAIGYALSAATSFLIFASDSAEGSRSVMFWLLGSLGLAAWNGALAVAVVVVAAAMAYLVLVGRRLDALVVGDETALTLGVHPERFRTTLLVLVSLVVGVLVAMAGSIGFVGLVIPHLARRLVGGAHRVVVPVAALLGAILLVWADVVARTVLAPQEIPIGIITALVGAPFLLLLVRRFQAVPS
ncbi:iron ABC transporter permease [Nocardioides zeae]|uniref:Iron ABC transporter permease n=1 Tax=Nocardioides imazamoxiresistens TaxID=3231893 RepID=A0ABU3Q0H8_9ACTN|nr:iron ABC transporter permease [Nocardioides zeae]MDT9594985.1 iron ABC transporter permease [Nocardioides zeae]